MANGGVGIRLTTDAVNIKGVKRRMIKIEKIDPLGPAAQSGGVKVGDVLLAIDDADATSHEALVCA